MEPAESDTSLEELVREHAALRRVATLVAREPPRAEIFHAVTQEAATLLYAQRSTLLRVASPKEAEVVASWSDGSAPPLPVGDRGVIDGRGILGQMLHTRAPVRMEDFDEAGGRVAALMRSLGVRSAAGGPITIGGRVWGALLVAWPDDPVLPPGVEHRIAAFAELVAYAIENAEARDELAASRARLVEAADDARRRIERDLHDGAQQRLVAAALDLTVLEKRLNHESASARSVLARAREHLDGGLRDLRDLARGIHPSVLTDRGLAVALEGLVKRAPMPLELSVAVPERLDRAIEAAVYFLVSEAITNAAKHARAHTVTVEVAASADTVAVAIGDDGAGGADARHGSGLRGLVDRLEAVGGHLEIDSVPGQGTRLSAELPTRVLATVPKARAV